MVARRTGLRGAALFAALLAVATARERSRPTTSAG